MRIERYVIRAPFRIGAFRIDAVEETAASTEIETKIDTVGGLTGDTRLRIGGGGKKHQRYLKVIVQGHDIGMRA